MGIFVKLCGLCSAKDVEAAVACRPDALGFVFYPASPRAVSAADVADWTRGVPADLLKVGVCVGLPVDRARRLMAAAGLDLLQLHGRESPAYCLRLDRRCWKAFPGGPPDAVEAAAPYPVEAFLLDSGRGAMPGGTGRVGDWDRAAEFVAVSPRPVVLAGGLTPENVVRAVRRVRPWGVDASSGVENAPGRKNSSKMKDFVDACRSFDR